MPRSLVALLVVLAVGSELLQTLEGGSRVSSQPMANAKTGSEVYVVDALESRELASLESDGGVRVVVPRAWLPVGAREGHVLTVERSEGNGRTTLLVEVDEGATEARRAAMRERREGIPKGPAGDLDL
jgi:hypothetical protein